MQVGFGGSLWYTMGIVIPMLLFAVLCIQLKTRAPGAKTYAQVRTFSNMQLKAYL